MAERGLFDETTFRHSWRPYQARVLAAMTEHLEDEKLHVVAPPGSGKTVLGLAAVIRLNRPALILVPTLTIREQWVHRFQEDFLPSEDPSAATIGTNVFEPASITVSTYQGIASSWRKDPAAVLGVLRKKAVGTLVVDEAHHLRGEWWRCLESLASGLSNLKVVGLTGTPPYDAPQAEWNRYAGFCGDVDEEISVPELVKNHVLCPHQDLVFLCEPKYADAQRLASWYATTRSFINDYGLNLDFAARLAEHETVRTPQEHGKTIGRNHRFYLAIAVYLHNTRPETAGPLVAYLKLENILLPAFDRQWAEPLFRELTFGRLGETFLDIAERGRIKVRLEAANALPRGTVSFVVPVPLLTTIRQNASKLRACAEIVEAEHLNLGDELRLVVLADHIRAAVDIDKGESVLGVVPIFCTLLRRRLHGVGVCAITGSWLVADTVLARELAEGLGTQARIWRDMSEYRQVDFNTSNSQSAVQLVTRYFGEGRIHVLVGTAALLGEGWDAPFLNTLVLASGVSAFVGTNQMRGRALRLRAQNPAKSANIWHVACIDPHDVSAGGQDLLAVQHRFKGFIGLSAEPRELVSGVLRMGLPKEFNIATCTRNNDRFLAKAARRNELREDWATAISLGSTGLPARQIRELEAPATAVFGRLDLRTVRGDSGFWARITHLFKDWRAKHLLLRIGKVVAAVMAAHAGIDKKQLAGRVKISGGDGRIYCFLSGASYYRQSRFIENLAAVFNPLGEPRYLIRYKHNRFYTVPERFGARKTDAMIFASTFSETVGQCELVYTRNATGRKVLLGVVQQALLSGEALRVDTRWRWQSGRAED